MTRPFRLLVFAIFALAALPALSDENWCEWPTADGRLFTRADFEKLYFEKQPLVLENLMNEWPAVSEGRWTKERIMDAYGTLAFDASDMQGGPPGEEDTDGLLLRDLLNSSRRFNAFVQTHHDMVRKMRAQQDWSVPEILSSMTVRGPLISIGSKMQGSYFHDHTHNWLSQVQGRKRWFVLPPEHRMPNDILYWRRLDPCGPRPNLTGLSGCIVRAGQIAYVPSFYMHESCLLDKFNIGVGYIGRAVGSHGRGHESDLSLAVIKGDWEYVKSAIREGASIHEKNGEGEQLLHVAAFNGHEDIAKWLISQRADVHATSDINGSTGGGQPMHAAAKYGHLSIIKLLAQYGASLNAVTEGGGGGNFQRTPLASAISAGHLAVLNYFIQVGAVKQENISELQNEAAAEGHVKCLELLHHTAKQSSRQQKLLIGNDLLFSTSESGHAALASFAIAHGADARGKHMGYTFVYHAAANGHVPILRVLVENRASLASIDKHMLQGRWATPMHYAAQGGHIAVMKYLKSHNADLTSVDFNGGQAVHVAAVVGHALVAEYLASEGVDLTVAAPNPVASIPLRPAQIAKRAGHRRFLNQLLQLGVVKKKRRTETSEL